MIGFEGFLGAGREGVQLFGVSGVCLRLGRQRLRFLSWGVALQLKMTQFSKPLQR